MGMSGTSGHPTRQTHSQSLGESGSPGEATYVEAIRAALEDAMRADEGIVLLGQDISAGFPFGATRELAGLFGAERVRDTPISEAATMGAAIGAAAAGVRTVVEVDFAGFLLLGLDQLVNNAAKLRYMSGGQLRVPLVVRVGQGPFGAFAAQHSQSQHAWLASVPGLALCAPATVQDAYDLLRWALRASDPVVFAEDMRLYRQRGLLERGGIAAAPSARIAREGSDATAVCYGYGVRIALQAAEELSQAHGIELEVLDLRLLSPLDEAAIGASARHTGRVLCVGDDPLLGGITATLAAVVHEQAHEELAAPVARLAARHLPTPFGSAEQLVYPSAQSVFRAVRRLVRWPEPSNEPEFLIEHGALRIASGR
jgi:pyruvate/2-oxoglutarate/acetoin dehydrogenase E1 component